MRPFITLCFIYLSILGAMPAYAQVDLEAMANQTSTTKTAFGRKEMLETGYFHESIHAYAKHCGLSIPNTWGYVSPFYKGMRSNYVIATCPTTKADKVFGGAVDGYIIVPGEANVRDSVTRRSRTVRAYEFATVSRDSRNIISLRKIGGITSPEELFSSFRTIERGNDLYTENWRVDKDRPNLVWAEGRSMSWSEALLIGALFYSETNSEFAQNLRHATTQISPFIEQKVSLWPESMRKISPKFDELMSLVHTNLTVDPNKSLGLTRSQPEFLAAEKALATFSGGERRAEQIDSFFTPESVLKLGSDCMGKIHQSILSDSFAEGDPGRFPFLDKVLYHFEGTRVHGNLHRAAADLLRSPFPPLRNAFWPGEVLPSGLAILANESCNQLVLRLKHGTKMTSKELITNIGIVVLTLDEFSSGYGSGTIRGAEAYSSFANERRSMEGTSFLCTPIRCFTGKFEELVQSNEVELSSKLPWPSALKARILAVEVKRHNARVKTKKHKN